MDVRGIIAGLQEGALKPSEIAEYYLQRYEIVEPKVCAWEEYANEKILEYFSTCKIEQIDWDKNTLACVPLGVKDCYNTEDFFTKRGSPIYKSYRAGNDARLIRKFRDEGAFVFGKTTTAELSVHAPAVTRNPYHFEHTPGTSSGGSACAVATDMVPIAVGTQTAASTSKPCSYCGIYGYKPTFGLFPRTGVLKTSDTLDTLTLLARSVDDIEYVFDKVRLKGENYPLIHSLLPSFPFDHHKCKIAFITDSAAIRASQELIKNFEIFKHQLKDIPGISVDWIPLPSSLEDIHDNHKNIYNKSVSYYFKEEYFAHPELLSEVLKQMIVEGQQIPNEQYAVLLQKQNIHMLDFHEWLKEKYDFIITPATMSPAPLGMQDCFEKDFSLIWTYLGVPLLIVPMFIHANGLPYGIQICSEKYSDEKLLKFGLFLKERGILKDANIVTPK